MTIFKPTTNIDIVCESQKTRNGFRHVATVLRGKYQEEKHKICYQNRTWERYEFDSLLERIALQSDILDDEEKVALRKFIQDRTSN